jgi:hypothetical protein
MFGVVAVAVVAAPAASGPRWPVVRTPSPPGPPNGTLFAVSCASADDCMAIGSTTSGGGVIVVEQQARFRRWSKAACATPIECLAPRARQHAAEPNDVVIVDGPSGFVEHWDGSGWRFAAAPTVTDGLLFLNAVDCPAANTCFAAGSLVTFTPTTFEIESVVMRWNGSAWTKSTIPDVAGSFSTALNAIDCTSATNCVAVGDYLTGNPNQPSSVGDHPLIARWNGTTWTLANVTAPAGSAEEFLADVSCAGGTCVAVGGYLDGAGTAHPLTAISTGSTWTAASAPIPGGANHAQFISVACTSATGCVAGGSAFAGALDDDDPSFIPLAERWNGTSWSTDAVPLPPGTDGAGIQSVACAGASDCSAVGFGQPTGVFDPFGDDDLPLHLHWNGTSWSPASGPDPTPFGGLFDVTCPAANTCFAVGGPAVVEQWNGTAWFISHFAGKASQSSLAAVDCVSATSCIAVGTFRGNADQQPLAQRWNGSTWQTMTVPPPLSGNGALTAVSCRTASDCTAVGTRARGNSIGTLVEHWNGSTWSIVPSPNPQRGLPVLADVDCRAAGRCVAVGSVITGGSQQAFSAVSRNGRWTLAKLPIPDFAEISAVPSVSCATATNCFATGVYLLVTGDRREIVKGLLAQWNGSRWQARAGARIEGDPAETQRSTVSCVSSTRCVAVGLFLASGDPRVGPITVKSFVERWDGRGWKARTSDNLIPFADDDLSCISAISCYVVGSDFESTSVKPAVAHWNGHGWTRASAGMPAGATRAAVTGVDCPTSRVCFAVGSYQNAAGSFTLALRGT